MSLRSNVKLIIQFNGKYLTLPINPENINPSRKASNKDIQIIGLGNATIKGEPGLTSFSIDSFFPGPDSEFYTGVKPSTCIKFINEIWNTENTNNNVARIVISGIPVPIDMYFVIDSFNYNHNAGDEYDIPYSLKIKKYIPYGVTIVTPATIATQNTRATSTANTALSETTSSVASTKTYKVQSGDCLYNIAKAASGNGNNWNQLYELNKSIIGSNPNSIQVGQVLVLPTDWNVPSNVTKLKSVTKTSDDVDAAHKKAQVDAYNTLANSTKRSSYNPNQRRRWI